MGLFFLVGGVNSENAASVHVWFPQGEICSNFPDQAVAKLNRDRKEEAAAEEEEKAAAGGTARAP